jgi:hypothetical protein
MTKYKLFREFLFIKGIKIFYLSIFVEKLSNFISFCISFYLNSVRIRNYPDPE